MGCHPVTGCPPYPQALIKNALTEKVSPTEWKSNVPKNKQRTLKRFDTKQKTSSSNAFWMCRCATYTCFGRRKKYHMLNVWVEIHQHQNSAKLPFDWDFSNEKLC
jgi:hypothetical protein